MPYTDHGYWFGPGEPTEPAPPFVARCMGPPGCPACARDAFDALTHQVEAMTRMFERIPDVHMRFHLLQEDGTHTELPCADWCYACRLDKAVERAEQAEATVRVQVVAELRRAARGRAHYAGHAPVGAGRAVLETEAATYAKAAWIAGGGDPELMLSLLPLVMWTEDEERLAIGPPRYTAAAPEDGAGGGEGR